MFLTAIEPVNHKRMNIKPKISLLGVTTPLYVIAKEEVKGWSARKKVFFFVLELLGPILPKLLESLLWAAKSYHYQRKKSIALPI